MSSTEDTNLSQLWNAYVYEYRDILWRRRRPTLETRVSKVAARMKFDEMWRKSEKFIPAPKNVEQGKYVALRHYLIVAQG